jgi:hypothetical protein
MDHFSMKKQASPPQNPQSGSIFFWIFAMIFLFGALSFAMIQSGRQGASNITSEKAKLEVTHILDFGRILHDGIKTAMIANGCLDTQISFYTPNGAGLNYPNASAPADERCHLFSLKGAGLNMLVLDEDLFDPAASNSSHGDPIFFVGHTVGGAGTPNADLILFYNGLSKEICMAINKSLGINNPVNDAPAESVGVGSIGFFQGTYDGVVGDPIGDNPALTGKKAGCMKRTDIGSGFYQFYYLLLAK